VNNLSQNNINLAKPWVLIPAYEPTPALFEVVTELLGSGAFHEIILVNDGSSQSTSEVIQKVGQLPGVTVLTHVVNRGKGQAIKTGLNYYLLKSNSHSLGLVTADADGQHRPEDVVAVAKAGMDANCFTLGVRDFPPGVPLRSRFGNILTRLLFRLFTGVKIQDTQTGLRFIPRRQVSKHIQITHDRYEYEFAVLVSESFDLGEKIAQIPISTVYSEGNSSSQFHPIRDSLAIYSVFLKFTSLSLISSILDYLAFSIVYLLTTKILLSFIIARIVSVIFNFLFSRSWVFQARQEFLKQSIKYLLTVFLLMMLTYNISIWLSKSLGTHILLGKMVSEGSLFLLSYFIQRFFIFKKKYKLDK
jgi:glycosyltransferase involved in cell wall biosynthesis